MATGKVKWFNVSKGFGFIEPDGGGSQPQGSRVKTRSLTAARIERCARAKQAALAGGGLPL